VKKFVVGLAVGSYLTYIARPAWAAIRLLLRGTE